MSAYIIRRLLAFVPTLFIAVTLIFVLTRMVPGNPANALIGVRGVTAEKHDELVRQLGYDKPIPLQYIDWLQKIAHGDFGTSVFFKKPVIDIILDRFAVTLSLSGLSMLITLIIAIPLGVISAKRPGSILDSVVMIFSTLGVSVPIFWFGFIMMLLFAVNLGWFPAAGYRPLSFGFFPWLERLVLPVFTLGFAQVALLVRHTRSSMLEVLNREYITTARAKGLSETKVIYKHAFKNAFVDIITVIGLVFALSLGGAVLIENVFAIPGIGNLITTAAIRRDYPIIEGGIAFVTFVALVVNLIVDISYPIINPRVNYE
jgi:peptide/nickel transport system permease protein|tara:strand:- start:428 stop:1375 length:948 start_codon:yes stop_codon:yes gene_type:complete